MFEAKAISVDDKATLYRELAQQLGGLLHGERDAIANAANTAALLFTALPDLNWAGFYFLRSPNELVYPSARSGSGSTPARTSSLRVQCDCLKQGTAQDNAA